MTKTIDFRTALATKQATQAMIDRGLVGTPAMYNDDIVQLVNFASRVEVIGAQYNSEVITAELATMMLNEIQSEVIEAKGGKFSEEYDWVITKIDGFIAEIER